MCKISELQSALEYSPENGSLIWKYRPDGQKRWNSLNAGRPAFTHQQNGYMRGTFKGKQYLAHRVVWAICHGCWPKGQIDHINGDRSDNRICNLRDVTALENARNAKRRSDNKSGQTGVVWHKASQKWSAHIGWGETRKWLGLFSSLDRAVAARKKSEKEQGYHENHGRNSQQARNQRSENAGDAANDMP